MRRSIRGGLYEPLVLRKRLGSITTHLLGGGTDLRYLQALLGHQSVRTSELYTHVSTKNIVQVRSPLDFLMRKDEHVLPPNTQRLLKTERK